MTNPTESGVAPPCVVAMGVTGCGKTTVGQALAHRFDIPFADADDFHPAANIDKMAAGHPLTDDDRWPWLGVCGRWLEGHSATGAVLACSALRASYRDALRAHVPGLYFVHLDGPQEVVLRRVAARFGHFMPAALVQSQYDTLEPLVTGERGAVVSFDQPVALIVEEAYAAVTSVSLRTSGPAT